MIKRLVFPHSSKLSLVGLSTTVFVVLFAQFSGPAPGQSQDIAAKERVRKPAWKWSIDERVAERTDPARADTRRAGGAQRSERQKLFGLQGFEETQPSINGNTEPELLMPSELFASLISDAFPENGRPGELKERIEDGAVVLGFGRDLWPRLEKVAAPYLRVRKERYQRAMASQAKPADSIEGKGKQLLECRVRAEALERAKAEFGEEAFLRLLYEVVAPPMSFGYSVEANTPENLRFVEGGCR